MLSVAKEHLLDRASTAAQKAQVAKFVTVHGQELSPTNYAICQSDLLIKDDRQAKVFPGNSPATPSSPTTRTAGTRAINSRRRSSTSTSCSPIPPSASPGAVRTVMKRKRASWRKIATAPVCPASTTEPCSSSRPCSQKCSQRKRGQPHRHHLQWLRAFQRRLRLGRKRNPPLDPSPR